VKTPFISKSLSLQARRHIELAIAVAQERLLATHVEHALELIELVGDHVPFDDALEIYNRLLRITPEEQRIITTRALAILGDRDDQPRKWHERMADADAAAAQAEKGSFLGHFRNRLRGRINDELRHWIELEAARTEVAILHTHVANAVNFVEILRQEMSLTEATELYLEALDVRDSIGEVVYYITLARLNESVITARARTPAIQVGPATELPQEERLLRVVEGDSA
jgi:tetratricopeptide (TPR) repeat protein